LLSWFAVRTHFAQEERAESNLVKQGYETLLPMARVESRRRDGLLVKRLRPLFSGYLFVKVRSEQRWEPISGTAGVTNFVGYTPGLDYPPEVRERDIHELRSRLAEAGGAFEVSLSRPQGILPGTLVRILFGPFRDRAATVQADCGSRVEVLLQAAGAMSRLRLPRECLAAA